MCLLDSLDQRNIITCDVEDILIEISIFFVDIDLDFISIKAFAEKCFDVDVVTVFRFRIDV